MTRRYHIEYNRHKTRGACTYWCVYLEGATAWILMSRHETRAAAEDARGRYLAADARRNQAHKDSK
jgi:hypothetical protein